MYNVVESICQRVQCPVFVDNLQRIRYARNLLACQQRKEVLERLLGTSQPFEDVDDAYLDAHRKPHIRMTNVPETSIPEIETSPDLHMTEEELGNEEEEPVLQQPESHEDLPDDVWHGYFKGFKILSEAEGFHLNENKKCIEINRSTCNDNFDIYLRSGVRCFALDLFTGSTEENQKVIVKLHEGELSTSKEIGYPVRSTIIAKLSPRLQYTGLMQPPDATIKIYSGAEMVLTVERYWSTRCNAKRVFVNATFLLNDVEPCDFVLIGKDIQLRVESVHEGSLKCKVVEGGILSSRLPVLFPAKCNKTRTSLEELEDITFAKEVGVNVLVSYIPGTKGYFDDLRNIFALLDCSSMRLFARVVLNDLKGCGKEHYWMAECYDGFLIDLNVEDDKDGPSILQLCPAAECFMKHVYELGKPVIFDPQTIAEKRIIVGPEHYLYVYYYPDKYIFGCNHMEKSFYFDWLQTAIFEQMPAVELSENLYCDASAVGADTLARAATSAAFEMNAAAIFVCSQSGRMAFKISHFRPKVPVLCITNMRSAETFFSLYHNLILLYYRSKCNDPPDRVFNQLLFGVSYAAERHIIKHENNVILVFAEGITEPKNYVALKFDEKNFCAQLKKIFKKT